jgi:glycosyltransferase involved in cell wall biosynthesis
MRVALIHDWLVTMRGGEKCLEAFCELFPDADLYTLVYAPENVSAPIRRMKVHTSWINDVPIVRTRFRYLLPLFPAAVEGFDLCDYDLIISSSHCVAKGVFPHRALHVAYIHSPMRYVWDMYDAYFTDEISLERIALGMCLPFLRRWDVKSSGRVDCFVANSANVAAKIRRFYAKEATVIYPPVDCDKFLPRNQQSDYYLLVSALVPYKRLDIAVAAFNRLQLPLKIAGDGSLRKRLERSAERNIEFLGWVNDETLAQLYGECRALIFPGEEDFGIVPVEAQAAGRPVIGYGKGGLLETVTPLDASGGAANAKDATGIFFMEQTAASLIAAVKRFERTMNAFDPIAIRKHSARFSRARFNAQITQFIQTKLRSRKHGIA